MVETDREEDGRWFGEISWLPGVMAYGKNPDEARRNTIALAFRVIGDRVENGEPVPVEAKELLAPA
jgi:predicted RNase H-like HicB family nuclease